MSARLTAGEALECVLNDDYSSGEESSIEEDPQFPLPVAFSDDESLTPPVSPVRNSHAHSTPPSTSTRASSMSTAGTGSPSLSAPPTSSARVARAGI